jgi:outer membrane protein TolC
VVGASKDEILTVLGMRLFLITLCLGWAGRLGAAPLPLADLEMAAVEQALTVRVSEAERTRRRHGLEAAQAEDGARLQAGAGLARVREPLSDTAVRRYDRSQVQIGLRWPLLGSREARQRAVEEADVALALAELQTQEAQAWVRLQVRRSYLELVAARQRAAAARAWLQAQPSVSQALKQREASGWLLEADRLAYQTQADTVERDLARQELLARAALRELQAWAGPAARVLEDPAPSWAWPRWPLTCRSREALQAAAEAGPALARARLEGDAARRAAQRGRLEGVDAGLTLSQTLSRDLGGSGGYSTFVGIDLSVPLQWRHWNDARRAQSLSAAEQAEARLALERQEQMLALGRAIDELALRERELEFYVRRQAAAIEAWRIAQLRTQVLEGDGYERAVQARYALYQAVVEQLDARARAHRAEIELLAWNPACADAQDAEASPSVEVLEALSIAPAAAVPRGAAGPLGWYVWNGEALLAHPERLAQLPSATGRLLLSWQAATLERLASDPTQRATARALMDAIRQRGWQIEWLLGEPSWVYPARRDELVHLVRRFSHWPFDALHLDLERSQLPAGDQPRWDAWVVETLQAVRTVSPWPIRLTTHYRELTEARLGERLREAGVSEVTAMIYVTRSERALQLARQALDAAPAGLKVSLAWSMEPGLDAQHSHFRRGRRAALAQWQAWHEALVKHPRYAGWIVQSLDHFFEAAP